MAQVSEGAIVRLPGESEQIRMGSVDVIFHAGRHDTDASFTLIETREHRTDTGPPIHVHRDAGESFLVLAGRYVMHVDGRDFHVRPARSYTSRAACRTHSEPPPTAAS